MNHDPKLEYLDTEQFDQKVKQAMERANKIDQNVVFRHGDYVFTAEPGKDDLGVIHVLHTN